MAQLKLEVVTPERVLLDITADYVTVPGELGELGILPGHLPVLTSLVSGVLSYQTGGETHRLAVHYGFAQIHGDQITVVAKLAEHGREIDADRIQKKIENIREELGRMSDKELDREQRLLEGKLARAVTRQHAAGEIIHH